MPAKKDYEICGPGEAADAVVDTRARQIEARPIDFELHDSAPLNMADEDMTESSEEDAGEAVYASAEREAAVAFQDEKEESSLVDRSIDKKSAPAASGDPSPSRVASLVVSRAGRPRPGASLLSVRRWGR